MGMLENKQLLYEDEDDALDWSYLEDYLNIQVGMRMVKLADSLYGACEWMSKPNMESFTFDDQVAASPTWCRRQSDELKINPDNNQEEHLRTQLNGGVILDGIDVPASDRESTELDKLTGAMVRSQSYKIYQLMWIMMHQEAQFAKQLLNFKGLEECVALEKLYLSHNGIEKLIQAKLSNYVTTLREIFLNIEQIDSEVFA
ncbi:hypothetical protein Tco_0627869 [Tanacetum coccineum]|uniref:Uncharacterized protein n=1 Tax=Tanacetum coccineum TaxID=301880 RepID=A0ABQ4WNS9_9ASTR